MQLALLSDHPCQVSVLVDLLVCLLLLLLEWIRIHLSHLPLVVLSFYVWYFHLEMSRHVAVDLTEFAEAEELMLDELFAHQSLVHQHHALNSNQHNNTTQDKTRQDKTRQDKTRVTH